jgi:hypothetical protein
MASRRSEEENFVTDLVGKMTGMHLAVVVSAASLLLMSPPCQGAPNEAASRASAGPSSLESSAKCSPEVEKKLSSLQATWGDFRYTCRHGFAASLEFTPSGPLSRDWRRFVLQNAEIFGTTASDLEETNEQYTHYFWQTYRGVRTNGGEILAQQGSNTQVPSGLSAQIVDTKNWTVSTVPKISSAAASRIVMAAWNGALGSGVASIDDMWLLVGSMDGNQILYWTVLGSAPGNVLGPNLSNGPTRIGCEVNALDGSQLHDCARAVAPRDSALHFESGQQLILEVKPDKPTYFEGDEINFEVTIKNISSGSIRAIAPRIYSCAEDSRSTIKIDVRDVRNPEEAMGQYCPYMNDVFESGTADAMLEHTVVLLPGQKHSMRVPLQQSASQVRHFSCDFEKRGGGKFISIGNQLPNGRYRIQIRYAPKLDYYWGNWMQSRYGDIWTGTLASSEFDIQVQPRP